jgi:perosamine synthetase
MERKREIFNWYKQELSDMPGVRLNPELPNTQNAFWMITVVLDPSLGLDKNYLQTELSKRNIDTRPFFHPLSSIPAYHDSPPAQAARKRNRVSYRLSPYGLNLPSGLNMTEETVRTVCDAFREIVEGKRS